MCRTYKCHLPTDKGGKGNLTVVWLDLANAYGTVPHKLIGKALDHCHVPGKVIEILASYFERIHLRFSVQDYITSWQRVEKGIVTGCTRKKVVL